MGILSWVLLGAIAGVVGRWIASDRRPLGAIKTILIGLAGAVLGGWFGSLLGIATVGSLSFVGIAFASAGAALIIWLWQRMAPAGYS